MKQSHYNYHINKFNEQIEKLQHVLYTLYQLNVSIDTVSAVQSEMQKIIDSKYQFVKANQEEKTTEEQDYINMLKQDSKAAAELNLTLEEYLELCEEYFNLKDDGWEIEDQETWLKKQTN